MLCGPGRFAASLCTPVLLFPEFCVLVPDVKCLFFASSSRAHAPMIAVGSDDSSPNAMAKVQLFEYNENTRSVVLLCLLLLRIAFNLKIPFLCSLNCTSFIMYLLICQPLIMWG